MIQNFHDKDKKIDFLKDINKQLLKKIKEQELKISNIEENHENEIQDLAIKNEELHQEESNKNIKVEFLLKKKRWRNSLLIKRENKLNGNYLELLQKEKVLKKMKEELVKKEMEIIQNSLLNEKDFSEDINKKTEKILNLTKDINLKKKVIKNLEGEKKVEEQEKKLLNENSLDIKINKKQSDTNNSDNIKLTVNTLKKFPIEGIMKQSSLEPLKIKENNLKKEENIEEDLIEKITNSNIEIDKTILKLEQRNQKYDASFDGISHIIDRKKDIKSNFESDTDSQHLMENINILDNIYKKKKNNLILIEKIPEQKKKICCEFFIKKKIDESFLNFSKYFDYFN